MNPLLTLPNYSHKPLPALPQGYVGYFQSQRRQLVFAFDLLRRTGQLYASDESWVARPCAPSHLPPNITKNSPEAAWLSACWQSALAIATNIALENLFSGKPS